MSRYSDRNQTVGTPNEPIRDASIEDQLEDATPVLDAFHVVKLGTAVVDEVRHQVQQDTLGHRGRKGDPLFGIQTILRAGAEHLTESSDPA